MHSPTSDPRSWWIPLRWLILAGGILCLAWLLILLLPPAAQPPPDVPRPGGLDLPGLAHTQHATPLQAEHYVEAVLRNGRWDIYQDSVSVRSGDADEVSAYLRTLFPDKKPEPHGPLLISAEGTTPLREVIPVARPAMNGGGHGVHFLVAGGPGVKTVHLRSSGASSIDPFLIYLRKDGMIQAGSGSSAIEMDPLDHGPPFPKLDEALDIFSAATEAAGVRGMALLVADSTTSLQDFLTLAARIGSYGIRVNMTSEWSAPEAAPAAVPPKKKPLSPSSRGARVITGKELETDNQAPIAPDR